MLNNNLLALVITFAVALAWLRINNYLARRGWISSQLSRKIIHIGTGPLFVLCWLLFDNAFNARLLAALVPAAITVQFFLVGTGIIHDEGAVRSMSRSGEQREILRGPLYYGIIFVIITLVYWKKLPIGIIALMLMCGGDGLADIFGRRFTRLALPWNPEKTLAGSIGMLIGGWVFTIGILAIYLAFGIFPGLLTSYLPAVTLIALAGTLVESLPFHDVDNLTVTFTALVIGHVLLIHI